MMRSLARSSFVLLSIALSGSVAQPDAAKPPERPWTLLIYGAADNNADGPILEFLDSIRTALDADPGMELVLFLDRSDRFSNDAFMLGEDFTGARIYRLRRNEAERMAGGAEFPEITLTGEYEADSSDPANLQKFIAFGKRAFPAQRYGLMIYSHADGITMCPDEQSHGDMQIAALTHEIKEAASVDFLALELCNMGGIEIGYQWRPGSGGFSADVLVAIPNAGPPLDWDRAFARIRSKGHATKAQGATLDPATMTAADFGRLVIEEGEKGRIEAALRNPERADRVAHEAAAAYDLTAAAAVKKAVDALAVALSSAQAKDVFEALRGPGENGVVLNYVQDDLGERPYVDLYALLDRAAGCPKLPEDVRAKARAAALAVDAFVLQSFGMQKLDGFQPGKCGVFVVFPDGDATAGPIFNKSRLWETCAWYTPLEKSKGHYGRWAWCADGATAGNGKVENWFELLDSWFDTGENGGSNAYAW